MKLPISPSKTRLWLISLIFIVLCLGTFLWLRPGFLYNRGTKPLESYPNLPALQDTDRIAIISPHLDDETLGTGGLIAEARSRNIPVSIIFMTNGDDFTIGANLQFKTGYSTPKQLIAYGETRQQEAIKAVAKLGVDKSSLYFLGLPDRGLKELVSDQYAQKSYTAGGTLQKTSTYSLSFLPNLPYTGDATREALTTTLNTIQPTKIFTTSPQDRHTDHASTAKFVQEILPEITNQPTLYFFLVHYPLYPWPRGIDHQADLLPPPRIKQPVNSWQTLLLSSEIITKKQAAIDEYKSQLKVPSVKKLLNSLVRHNELFYDN